MSGDEIDWASWAPEVRANLLFVMREGEAGEEVLLIRKKRGFGAGKINGPGGKLEPGEGALESALRETEEEVGVRVVEAEARGELSFYFVDGPGIHVSVFVATGHEGEAIETDEAIPLWTPVGQLPLDEMWEDDVLWLPGVLAGGRCVGRFVFEGEAMVWQEVEWAG
jgi:8-oxo-dGTP diphosphatase